MRGPKWCKVWFKPEYVLFAISDSAFPGSSLLQGALDSIIKETAGGDNGAVGATAQIALDSVTKAQDAVTSIAKAIALSQPPQLSEYAPASPHHLLHLALILILLRQPENRRNKRSNNPATGRQAYLASCETLWPTDR